MTENQTHTETALKNVIEILHDAHKGMADIGAHLKDSRAKEFFLQESLARQQFAGELAEEMRHLGQHDAVKDGEIGGTASGAIHRVWGDLKAKLGGGDHTLLETAEQGEDAAKDAYKKALEHAHLPGDIREILMRQQTHILASHDKVKALRDAKMAA